MIVGIVLFVNRHSFSVYNKIGIIKKNSCLSLGRSRAVDKMMFLFLFPFRHLFFENYEISQIPGNTNTTASNTQFEN